MSLQKPVCGGHFSMGGEVLHVGNGLANERAMLSRNAGISLNPDAII
jgi:hypothetical protein